MTAAEVNALKALHAIPAAHLVRPLVEIGDRVQGQLHELAMRPTADGCERLAIELEGTRRHLLRIREALLRESQAAGDGLR